MPKVIPLIRETTGETYLIHPTIVHANGDTSSNLTVTDWGTDLLGMAKRFPDEKFFLKGGKFAQFIQFGNWNIDVVTTAGGNGKIVENGTSNAFIGITVNNLTRTLGVGTLSNAVAWTTEAYTQYDLHGRAGFRIGLYLLLNQYNCIMLAPLPVNKITEDTSVVGCYFRTDGQKDNYYPPVAEITEDKYVWGYRQGGFASNLNGNNMNRTPEQITAEMTAEQYGNNNTGFDNYTGYYWYNYQNTVDPDEPVTPSQSGFPYGDEPSKPQGGGGYMETDTEDIETPEASESSALDGGMVSLFQISKTSLQSLASFLWSDSFVDVVKSLYTNKGDVIVGLSELPVSGNGTASTIVLGDVSSGVNGIKINNRYVDKDFGSVSLAEYWGNFMDYAPYTKIELILPYADVVSLNTDMYQGKSITLKCRIDLMSGDMLYIVGNGTSAIDFVPANCNAQIPLASRDYTEMIGNALNGVGGMASSVATGNVLGGVNSALSFVSAKPSVSGIGSLVASRGNMGIHTPFVRITRPSVSIPANFPHIKGFRSNITATLGSLTGYTEVDTCHLDGVPCTATEKDMLMSILQNGIIL